MNSWIQRTVLSVALGAMLAVGMATSAQAGYCDVTQRSCASDDGGGDSTGGSYPGSAPRTQYQVGQFVPVAPGAPGWTKHAGTWQKCDDDFKYTAMAAVPEVEPVILLRIAMVQKREWWWFGFC